MMNFLNVKSKIYTLIRSYYKGHGLEPLFLKPGESISDNDSRLYDTIRPSEKTEHTLSHLSPVINKIIGQMLYRGRREAARDSMRRTLGEIKFMQLDRWHNVTTEKERDDIELDPRKIIDQALVNVSPNLVIKEIARGGLIYMVPMAVRHENEGRRKGVKFILEVVRNKDKNQRVWITLAKEFTNAAKNEGVAIRKKKDLYKQCEENRAYAFIR